MTPEEREKLTEDMAQGMAFVTPYLWEKMTKGEKSRMIDDARAALAIAEAAIREDCAEIAKTLSDKNLTSLITPYLSLIHI